MVVQLDITGEMIKCFHNCAREGRKAELRKQRNIEIQGQINGQSFDDAPPLKKMKTNLKLRNVQKKSKKIEKMRWKSFSKIPSSTIDLNILKSIEDRLETSPVGEEPSVQFDADHLRNKKQESDLQSKNDGLEKAIKVRNEEKSLHDVVDHLLSCFGSLVRDADEHCHNPETVPTEFSPIVGKLKETINTAKTIIANVPALDAHLQQLQQAVASAETLIPDLEERARFWDEFLVARNDIENLIVSLQKPLDAVFVKPKRPAAEVAQDVKNLRQRAQQLLELDNKIVNLQCVSELLDPFKRAYADVRFFNVEAQKTRHQYDDVLNEVATELEEETLLWKFADNVSKEIDDISKMIESNDPERLDLDLIAKNGIPALTAQVNRIKDKIVNSDHFRKYVTTDPKIADDLDSKLGKLKAELDDAIKNTLMKNFDKKLQQMETRIESAIEKKMMEFRNELNAREERLERQMEDFINIVKLEMKTRKNNHVSEAEITSSTDIRQEYFDYSGEKYFRDEHDLKTLSTNSNEPYIQIEQFDENSQGEPNIKQTAFLESETHELDEEDNDSDYRKQKEEFQKRFEEQEKAYEEELQTKKQQREEMNRNAQEEIKRISDNISRLSFGR